MKLLFSVLLIMLQVDVTFGQGESASAGGCGGHGGDGYSLEFYRIGKYLAQEFNSWAKDSFANLEVQFHPAEFEKAVEKTRIVSTQKPLFLDSKEVDAINYSDRSIPIIELSRSRWDAYKENRVRKLGIVIHEYLGIVKGMYGHGEWDSYPLSSALLALYESKNQEENLGAHEAKVKKIRDAFSKANLLRTVNFSKTKKYSCLELSSLKQDTSKYVHLDAFSFIGNKNYGSWHPDAIHKITETVFLRQWIDIDPTETIDRQGSTIKEYVRQSSNGDIITEVTTDYIHENQVSSLSDANRGVLSYLICSDLGSKTLGMVKFMHDSLIENFAMPTLPNYAAYVQQVRELANSKQNQKCKGNQGNSCQKLYERLSEIKLAAETHSIAQAKKNIESINVWLTSLSDKDNQFALRPLSKLFDRYLNHQSHLSFLLDINDPLPHNPDPGLDNFVESLENRVPLSYKAAKHAFAHEFNDIQLGFVKSFGVFEQ